MSLDAEARNYGVEARMLLQGLSGLLPTIDHLRALEELYEVRLIQIANECEALKKKVLNGPSNLRAGQAERK